ncbi:MAG: hypothetical protein CVU56_06010 [Deltaproteobacteria bacterium HGW-Deltaproteobacteria-14]|jgi:hypothetical protein|nr:MAG: hypothetical protein CVU56_06010 [Deltaproteobacteria bacterium HGW-Deltaproteobacteria-14]
MGRSIAILLALTLLSGCRERDPEEVAEEFVGTLEDYRRGPSTTRLEHAWTLLDEASQAPLVARAQAASASLGVTIEPWTLLRYDGLVRGDRVTRVESVAVGDDRARVAVHFAWGIPKSAGGPAEPPESTELSLTKTSGGWRVSLPLRVEPGGPGPATSPPGAPPPQGEEPG